MWLPQTVPFRQTHRNILPCKIPATISQSSMVCLTQSGIGTVRMWPAFPIKSTIAQWSSRRWRWSSVSSVNSPLRSPQPSKTAKIARSLFPFSVRASGSCQSARASLTVSQFPRRIPSFFYPFTRRMPAASSGLSSPESAAS